MLCSKNHSERLELLSISGPGFVCTWFSSPPFQNGRTLKASWRNVPLEGPELLAMLWAPTLTVLDTHLWPYPLQTPKLLLAGGRCWGLQALGNRPGQWLIGVGLAMSDSLVLGRPALMFCHSPNISESSGLQCIPCWSLAVLVFLSFLPCLSPCFPSHLPGIISQITICSQTLVVAPVLGRLQTKHIQLYSLNWVFFKIITTTFIFKFMCILLACTFLPLEARRGQWIPWDWSYRHLWAAKWILGLEPGSSERVAGALNDWVSHLSGSLIEHS